MAKLIFLLRRKAGTSREQCLSYWAGGTHTALVEKLPGLQKWVQNGVTGGPRLADCDGIGELWFASDEAAEAALASPEMARSWRTRRSSWIWTGPAWSLSRKRPWSADRPPDPRRTREELALGGGRKTADPVDGRQGLGLRPLGPHVP